MFPDGMLSIGELAEQAGVTVKTVRFYSDRGLLPEAARSSGGHRRYAPEALERLRLIRSLRALDVPVPEVSRALEREDALEDAVAGRLREVGSRLAALRWQEAALRLVQDCPAEERPYRLRLVGAVTTPPSTAALARFWRRWLPPRLPPRLVSAVLEQAVPPPPADPAPSQVLAFARLHTFVSGPCAENDRGQPEAHRPDKRYRPAVLYDGLVEAYDLASVHLRGQRAPHPGEALDCFVSAHACSRGVPDTPDFRRRLALLLAADPRIDQYWSLTAEVLSPPSGPPPPTAGSADAWLRAALDAEVTDLAR